MNKFSKFFAFATASIAFVGCTSDEPAPGPNNEIGETAYINVAIRDANSRAEGDEEETITPSDKFENGTADEYAVSDAKFFFFDGDGVYVGQADVWNGGTATKPNQNIEFTGNNVVVLENLKDKNAYPEYMVTVLNSADMFTNEANLSGMTIADFGKQLVENGAYTKDGKFLMTTTSYYDGKTGSDVTANHRDAFYFATRLDENNFHRTAAEAKADGNAVKVYVERLAARVEFESAQYFEIKATVAGEPNGEIADDEAATKLWVRIDNYGVNLTNPTSYLTKQFGKDWTATYKFDADVEKVGTPADWADWNDAANYRSYWGQSYNYGKMAGLVNHKPSDFNGSYDATKEAFKKSYCFENTTSVADLCKYADGKSYNFPSQLKTTNVEVFATVGTKEGNIFTPVELVEHNGLYFTKDRYMSYVLKLADERGKLNYYRKKGDVYTQLTAEDFVLAGNNNRVDVALVSTIQPNKLYNKTDEKDELGNTVFEENTKTRTEINNDLKALFGDNIRTRAYTGGQMHYTVPIAHLRDKKYEAAETNDNYKELSAWGEGSFGVVRNHTYKVKINSVARLGQGIFDPDQDIVTDEDPRNPEWYLGAQINILSWRIVNNNVDL